MNEKKLLLIQSPEPIGIDSVIKALRGLEEKDWLEIEQRAEKTFQTDSLDVNALHLCALKIRAGYSTPKIFEQTMAQQKVLAEKGDVDAILTYGYFLYLIEQHQEATCQFFEAIKLGSAVAMFNQARMYDFGLGSEVKSERAISLYFQAAKRGMTEALEVLNSKNSNHLVAVPLAVLRLLDPKISSESVEKMLQDPLIPHGDANFLPFLFAEMLEIISTKKMSKENFLSIFNWLHNKKQFFYTSRLQGGTEKIWDILAHAIQQGFLSDISFFNTLVDYRHYDSILSALGRLGERPQLIELILKQDKFPQVKEDLLTHLFTEMLELISAKRMSKETFFAVFNGLHDTVGFFNTRMSNAVWKIWDILAHAIQQNFLTDIFSFNKLMGEHYSQIFYALERIGARQQLSTLMLKGLNSPLSSRDKMSSVQYQMSALLSGSDFHAIVFQVGFRIYLDKLFNAFKTQPSVDHASLTELRALYWSPEAKEILSRCEDEHVNKLISSHRKSRRDEDVTALESYNSRPAARKYLDSLESSRHNTLGEQLKNEAIKGSTKSYELLLAEAEKHPEVMCWLGSYYEDYYKANSKVFNVSYPSKAINCYTASAKEGFVLAYERLANCYAEGALVAKDIEQSFYYHYEAGKLGSHSSTKKLESVEDSPRNTILANLYLAMMNGLKGPLSQYYNNAYLQEAVKIDRDETDAVILKLSENEKLDIHARLALLQVAFRHNCFVNAEPHRKILTLLNDFFGSLRLYAYSDETRFVKELVKYFNPHYLAEIVLNHHSNRSFLVSVTSEFLNKSNIKNEILMQLSKTQKYDVNAIFSNFNITPDSVEYRTSSIPVKKESVAPKLEEKDKASAFGQDGEFVEKPDQPAENSTMTGFRSLMTRGTTFLSSLSSSTSRPNNPIYVPASKEMNPLYVASYDEKGPK